MNDNPILYSDLVKDDGAIQNLINQLNEAINAFDTAKGKLQATATDLAKSLQSISGASEEQRQSISKAVQETEKLIEAYRNEDSAQRAAYRAKQQVTQAQKEAQQIDKLTIQLNNAKKGSYNALSAEYRLLKIQINAMGESEKEYAQKRDMEKKARALYEQMSNLQKATGKYTLEVGHYQNAMLGLPAPITQVTRALSAMGNNMRSVFSSEMPAGVKAIKGMEVAFLGLLAVVIAVGKALTGLIKTNADFEQQNANLATVLGKSRKDIENLTDTALKLGRTTQWTASQVTELQTELAKLGFGEGSIIAMQEHVLAFATAVGANLSDAANMAGATMRAFNLTSQESERVMGVLAVGVNNSALTFDRLKQAMGTVFPVANAFGLTVEDTVALLGALSNAGFSAETAATGARNVFIKLADENGKLAQKTGSAAKSFDDIIAKLKQLHEEGVNLSDIFGLTEQRAAAPFAALIEGFDKAEELRDILSDVSGELKRIQDERLNTVTGQTYILKSAWQGLILSFKESNGVIKSLIEDLTGLTQGLTNLLFPAQAATINEFERGLEKYREYYIKYGAEQTRTMLQDQLKVGKEYLDELSKDTTRRGKKNYEYSLSLYKGTQKAVEVMLQQITNDEQEAERQREMARQQQQQELEELTAKEKKDRLARLRARIEEIKMEITYTTEGTQEMLDKRLELVEAERQLELEVNRQAEESARKDVAIINAKFNHQAEETEKAHWEKVAKIRMDALNREKSAIDLRLSVVEEGSLEEAELRVASLEKQREIEIAKNNQLTEEMKQSELDIVAKYDKMIFDVWYNYDIQKAKVAVENMKIRFEIEQNLEKSKNDLLTQNQRQRTIFELNQERERLNHLLDIDREAATKMSAEERETIRNMIAIIDQERERLPYDNIYEVLNLNIDKNQQSALNDFWGNTKDLFDEIIDSYERMADAAVKSADKQVEAAQKTLDAEIEARNNGYANSVETARKELALAQKNREAALKEQRKAQIAQIALDSAQQSSSLITASANLWKAFSNIPVVGPALAIAAITTMWGSFAYAKIKAVQATKQEYGEGTVELLEGGSHASGNDIDLGYDKRRRKHRRAEGGEYFAVVNKRNSRKYRNIIPDVINSFNDGTFADKYQKTNEVMGGMAVNVMRSSTDVSHLERKVDEICKQGERQVYTDGENIVIRYKNLTQRIRK